MARGDPEGRGANEDYLESKASCCGISMGSQEKRLADLPLGVPGAQVGGGGGGVGWGRVVTTEAETSSQKSSAMIHGD